MKRRYFFSFVSIFLMLFSHSQDELATYGMYIYNPSGFGVLTAINAKRIEKSKIKKMTKYLFNLDATPYDSTLYYTVEYYPSGFEHKFYYPGKSIHTVPETKMTVDQRDSLIRAYVGSPKPTNTTRKVKNCSCRDKKWYDSKGRVYKQKTYCGLFGRLDATNSMIRIEYDSLNRVIKTKEYFGDFYFAQKLNYVTEYFYDSNGNLTEFHTLHPKTNKIRGIVKFYYEYW